MTSKNVIDWSMTIFCDYPFLIRVKIVIDRSMTFINREFQIVIDQSMTIFCDYPFPIQVTFPIQAQIVIDQSRTFFNRVFKNCHWPVKDNFLRLAIPYTSQNCHWPVNDIYQQRIQNCHWPVNDIFSKSAHPTMVSAKTVIDQSMTF